MHGPNLKLVFKRNKVVIEAIAAVFFITMIISTLATYELMLASPELVKDIQHAIGSARSYAAIPPAYSIALYQFIFRNNVGHFWNPLRIWVWIPFIGAFSLGYELLFNAILIGTIASFTSVTKSAAYSISGLAPHGVIEIPAFILEFAGLACWHVTMTRAIYSKLSGRQVDRPLLSKGIIDTIVLSLLSVALFAVAAAVETYVTPRLLGM